MAAMASHASTSSASSKTQGGKYLGITRRSCVCGRELCYQIWKFWCEFVEDDDQPGKLVRRNPRLAGEHVRVPNFFEKATTEKKRMSNFTRKVYFAHLFAKGSDGIAKNGPSIKTAVQSRHDDGRQYQFVALHHFLEPYLALDGSGLLTKTVSKKEADDIGLSESDRIQNKSKPNHGLYILPPTRSWAKEIVPEYEKMGGIVFNAANKENTTPRAPPRSVPAGAVLSERTPVQPRANPEKREMTRLTNQIKRTPDAFAVEFKKMERQLQVTKAVLENLGKDRDELKKKYEEAVKNLEKERQLTAKLQKLIENGLSRHNLISKSWHKKNKEASEHMFGSFTWKEFTAFWTKAAFPGIDVAC